MEINDSSYEDAKSNNNNINNNYFNYKNKNSFGSERSNENSYKKKGETKIYYNDRYNNTPENNNIIIKSYDNNDSQIDNDYPSPKGFEPKFEKENNSSYCSACKCGIF